MKLSEVFAALEQGKMVVARVMPEYKPDSKWQVIDQHYPLSMEMTQYAEFAIVEDEDKVVPMFG